MSDKRSSGDRPSESPVVATVYGADGTDEVESLVEMDVHEDGTLTITSSVLLDKRANGETE